MVRFTISSEQGGALVLTAGVYSTTRVQQSFPNATVTVYTTGGALGVVSTSGTSVTRLSGTPFNANGQWNGLAVTINSVAYTISSVASGDAMTLTSSAGVQSPVAYSVNPAPAAIFQDNSGTPKANPFTTDATGYGFFYAQNSTVDIRFSGSGIATPFTIAAVSGVDPVPPGSDGDVLYNSAGTYAATNLVWTANDFTIPVAIHASVSPTNPNIVGVLVAPLSSVNNVGLYIGAQDVLNGGATLRSDIGYQASGGAVQGRGMQGVVSFTGTQNWTSATPQGPKGMQGRATSTTTGTVALMSGVNGDISTGAGAGVVAEANSLFATVATATGTTITAWHGFKAKAPVSSGTVTAAYGFRAEPLKVSGVTGAFSFYADSDPAFFGGNVQSPLTTPASSSAAGVQGTIVWDANYVYVCVATNTWKRVAIATW